jgi:hypothetical protein
MNIHVMPDDTFVDEFIGFSSMIEGVPNEYWVDTKQSAPKIVKKHSKVADLSDASPALLEELGKADKIFIHFLTPNTIRIFSKPEFKQKKIYWVIWGSDLYQWLNVDLLTPFDFLKGSRFGFPLDTAHLVYNRFRLRYDIFISSRKEFVHLLDNLSGVMHYNKYDVELLNRQYGKSIPHIQFFYKNLIDWKELDHALEHQPAREENRIKVLLGNSATNTNNHFSILKKFSSTRFSSFHVYAILSYGDKSYAARVEEFGKEKLGERFHPVKDYMSAAQYTDLLLSMDMGIMNHSRSQGMGNIIVLLYLGKAVYLNPVSTTYRFLKDLGFTVFSTGELDTASRDIHLKKEALDFNKSEIRNYFSDANFLENLRRVYLQ